MDADDIDTEELRVRKDYDAGVVEVDTGDGWRQVPPDVARDVADQYADAADDLPGRLAAPLRTVASTLRRYADDVEAES